MSKLTLGEIEKLALPPMSPGGRVPKPRTSHYSVARSIQIERIQTINPFEDFSANRQARFGHCNGYLSRFLELFRIRRRKTTRRIRSACTPDTARQLGSL